MRPCPGCQLAAESPFGRRAPGAGVRRLRACLAGVLAAALLGGCATTGPIVGKGADPTRSALVCGAGGAVGGAAVGAGLGSIGGGGKGAGQGAIIGSVLGALSAAITCLLLQ
jgi:hypothetical protein